VFRTAPDGITGEFILDIANHKTMDSSNLVFTFGLGTDHIIVGDWNGNGKPSIFLLSDDERQIGVTQLDEKGRLPFPTLIPLDGKPLAMADDEPAPPVRAAAPSRI